MKKGDVGVGGFCSGQSGHSSAIFSRSKDRAVKFVVVPLAVMAVCPELGQQGEEEGGRTCIVGFVA